MGIMDGLVHIKHCPVCGFPYVEGRCLHGRLGLADDEWPAYAKTRDEEVKAKRQKEHKP